jgi:hypothetical protein
LIFQLANTKAPAAELCLPAIPHSTFVHIIDTNDASAAVILLLLLLLRILISSRHGRMLGRGGGHLNMAWRCGGWFVGARGVAPFLLVYGGA